jgi:glutamate synthase domain-containing protein 2/glutamate synthase domain-containing protein 3
VAVPPEIVVGSIDRHLMNLEIRHRVHLVAASEEINDPHTMFVLLQLGADALVPTMLCREMLLAAFERESEPGRFMLDGIRAIRKALAIMYGRIATNHFAAGRGGRKISPVGLGKGLSESMGLRRGVGSGIGQREVVRDLKAKVQSIEEKSVSLEDDVKKKIDTMPYKTSIAIYGLLGGFRNAGEESFSRKGQMSLARKTLLPVMKSRAHAGIDSPVTVLATASASASASVGTGGNGSKEGSIFKRVEELSAREAAGIVERLFLDYKSDPAHFFDSLLLKKENRSGLVDVKPTLDFIGSGLDGRSTNQIIGAISYGANNRYVHELYARVMALYGGMSNGGEGGVPDNIRALYITARIKKDGGGAKSLTAHLLNETPQLMESMGDEECERFVSGLLQSVPLDFTASRFEQISTGRFGVGAFAFLDTEFVEIKIGQGAKPGVGGSLPGAKVLPHIAVTRGVNVGQTLNSPTVHHDIYSIEDLRQLVTSLKTFNPKMKVCVKLAAMDDLDIVAVGVVKSGADFIWVDGYEGGTGSAKDAHKEHCGLPSAPIINRIHKLLLAEGMRGGYFDGEGKALSRSGYHRLPEREKKRYRWRGPRIIGAGGVRYAEDAVKLILAGSDYVGYGDAAQIAVGCVRCYKCPTGKCPSYITTNVKGSFELFDVDTNNGTLQRFVEILDTGMKELALSLDRGLVHMEELVGRTDFLERNPKAAFRADKDLFKPAVEERFDIETIPDARRDAARVMASGANRAVSEEFQRWKVDIEDAFGAQGVDINDINVFGRNGSTIKTEDELLSREICVVVTSEDRLIGANIVRDFIYLKNRVKVLTGKEIRIHIEARGPAGSGFGMFSVEGMDFTLTGTGGDYLGEAINGSRIFVLPFRNRDGKMVTGSGGAGNAVAYGMRDGEIHLNSMPGTRFAIRFSGGKAFIWGDPAGVENSFDDAAVTPQFFCEYMTKGTIVFCPTPGYNLLRAATGVGTEVLCRKPQKLGREEFIDSLEKRIPDSFEVTAIEERHVELIEKGKADYTERARKVGITEAVTPILENENLFDTFVLIREKEGTVR